jgi:hypothetical protein
LDNEVGGQARHELDGACLGLGGEPIPDLGGCDDGIGEWSLHSHKNTSKNETRGAGTLRVILTRIGRGRRGVVAMTRRTPAVSREAIEELEDLTEAVEIQEVLRRRREIALGRSEIIGAAQRDGGMPSVRESDDEIRINSPAEADDLDPFSAERMMGMGDGDESRGWLGQGGSVLGASPRSRTRSSNARC